MVLHSLPTGEPCVPLLPSKPFRQGEGQVAEKEFLPVHQPCSSSSSRAVYLVHQSPLMAMVFPNVSCQAGLWKFPVWLHPLSDGGRCLRGRDGDGPAEVGKPGEGGAKLSGRGAWRSDWQHLKAGGEISSRW